MSDSLGNGPGDRMPMEPPTAEQLRAGYTMRTHEKLMLDGNLQPEQRSTRYTYDTTDGKQIVGRPVAALTFKDGIHSFAEATIVDLGLRPGQFVEDIDAGKGIKDFAVLVASHETGTILAEQLEANQPWGFGRDFEGQSVLPRSVDDQQCIVGLDEQNRVTVENLDPHSVTVVQTF